MKKPWNVFPSLAALPAALLLAAGCGNGSNTSSASVAELTAMAPTSESMNLDIGDATGMSATLPMTSISDDAATLAPGMDICHPHLFARSAEVVWRLNAVFFRHLRHVEHLIAKRPTIQAGDSATWTETGSGLEVQRQLVISRSADGLTYEVELDLAPTGQTPPVWVKVLSGSITNTKTSTGSDRTADVVLDYDALHSVISTERLTGKITIAFERVADSSKPAPGTRRATTITFAGFSYGSTDPRGPRSGTFTHVGEPGVGGSLSFQDSLVLLCPANPQLAAADVVAKARWYVATDGTLHGRADAKATSGQIAAGDSWLGVTCYQGGRAMRPLATTETAYWAMKLEDGAGATVAGSAHQAGSAQACDSAFGVVPSQIDKASDYDFSAPLSFPNQW